mmetsp:Transcript_41546/g.67499  ORF Transcript_41546/g.67499 Transcript_41546/m.67499 type:complete len:213 (-) Transcript_41546:299-937(-)
MLLPVVALGVVVVCILPLTMISTCSTPPSLTVAFIATDFALVVAEEGESDDGDDDDVAGVDDDGAGLGVTSIALGLPPTPPEGASTEGVVTMIVRLAASTSTSKLSVAALAARMGNEVLLLGSGPRQQELSSRLKRISLCSIGIRAKTSSMLRTYILSIPNAIRFPPPALEILLSWLLFVWRCGVLFRSFQTCVWPNRSYFLSPCPLKPRIS